MLKLVHAVIKSSILNTIRVIEQKQKVKQNSIGHSSVLKAISIKWIKSHAI